MPEVRPPLIELGLPCSICLAYARSRLHWMHLTANAWQGRSEARRENEKLRAALMDYSSRCGRALLVLFHDTLTDHGINPDTLDGGDPIDDDSPRRRHTVPMVKEGGK